jgi:hypothetical protein
MSDDDLDYLVNYKPDALYTVPATKATGAYRAAARSLMPRSRRFPSAAPSGIRVPSAAPQPPKREFQLARVNDAAVLFERRHKGQHLVDG